MVSGIDSYEGLSLVDKDRPILCSISTRTSSLSVSLEANIHSVPTKGYRSRDLKDPDVKRSGQSYRWDLSDRRTRKKQKTSEPTWLGTAPLRLGHQIG